MIVARVALLALLVVGCGARTGLTVAPDADALDARDAAPEADAPAPIPCGASVCPPGQICARGRCGGCCDLPPSCVPVPSGCAGTLACGCFAADPCGGCTTCQSVELDGVHCGKCRCTCAAAWTPIATPRGWRMIADVREGELVYSLDHGELRAVTVARTVRTPVAHHLMVRVVLASGLVIELSGGHPTADGRTFDALVPGDRLGDAQVVAVESVPYDAPFTYDILPASDTGTYVAAGALVGSTLR